MYSQSIASTSLTRTFDVHEPCSPQTALNVDADFYKLGLMNNHGSLTQGSSQNCIGIRHIVARSTREPSVGCAVGRRMSFLNAHAAGICFKPNACNLRLDSDKQSHELCPVTLDTEAK
jgi:hypothetical protein